MVLEFPFGLEKFRAFTVEEEEEKKRGRRRREEGKKKKKEEGRGEVQEFKVWILVKDLYGIELWNRSMDYMYRISVWKICVWNFGI